MKKILFFTLLMSFSAAIFSQQTDPTPVKNKEFYLKKSKGQKTAAWVLLGAGTTMIAIAAPGSVSLDILPTLVIGGSACIISIIPLFIAAGRNKRKAMDLSFKMEPLPQLQKNGLTKTSVPSLTLKLHV